MNLSSFYDASKEAYIYFTLTTLHPTNCSIAIGELTAKSPSATGGSVGEYAQRQLPALVSAPVDWFFFPPFYSLATDEPGEAQFVTSRIQKLILMLYIDAIPGADVGVLRRPSPRQEVPSGFNPNVYYPGTSADITLTNLIGREYGPSELFLSGFDGKGAAVNILIGRGIHRKRLKKPKVLRKGYPK